MTDENIPKIKSLSALRAALEPDTAELQWLISDALVNKHGHDPSDAEQIARTYLTGEDDAVSHVIEGLKIEEVNTLLAVMGIGPEEVKAGIEKMERLLAPKGPA